MAAVPYFVLILFLLWAPMMVEMKLSQDYYAKTCPDFPKVVREIVTHKQTANPVTAAGALRLFFHDCMVNGCDASVLISSNHVTVAEREADINHSLSADALEVVVRAKTTLELTCPGVVSCSDILAEATRDLITMVGGPFYTVRLGRKDGRVSNVSLVDANIPRANQTMDDIINIFETKGFTIRQMVALTGGHTIGFSHCKEFADRLFHHTKEAPTDPEIHPKFSEGLKKMCANYLNDTAMAAFNDVITPGKFDNMYYQNLKRGLGLLRSDHALFKDPRTRPFVDLYATNQQAFFNDFAKAMEKLSIFQVKTGNQGEIRRRCDHFNDLVA